MLPKVDARAVVITPTIGTCHLKNAIQSVIDQDYSDLIHLVIIDGSDYAESVFDHIHPLDADRIRVMELPFNTGKGGFNGHRIYAASGYLVNADYVFFLDEDNWYDPSHVSSLISLMRGDQLQWAYSLRKIVDHEGTFITCDDCESLGRWPPYSRHPDPPHSLYPNLVDTSCYAFKRDTIAKTCHFWYHPLGADRYFFRHISSQYPYFGCSKFYTLNYRLHEKRPPSGNFFLNGNEYMRKYYNGELPWHYF